MTLDPRYSKQDDREYFEIAVPLTMPFGAVVTTGALDEVWAAFIRPDQDAGIPPEMRILMAVLRSVHAGLMRHEAPDA